MYYHLQMTKTLQRNWEQDIERLLGISKESDSIVVVVSEETGKISVAKDGTLIADVREDVLKKILISNIVTKRFTQKKTERNNKLEVIKKKFSTKQKMKIQKKINNYKVANMATFIVQEIKQLCI